MDVKINGKAEAVNNAANLLEVVLSKGLSPEKIVVEYNLSILPQEKWQQTLLRENDCIEIISFVGGG